jgi:hypothetical protein
VEFAVAAGGGVVSPQTVTSDGGGLARTQWTLGPVAGAPAEVVATLQGLPPVAFHATARPGPPAKVRVVAGNGQSATRGTLLPDSVVARVEDAHGNPLSGVPVSWSVVAGAGHVELLAATSRADGTVHTRWAVGFTPGENTLDASVNGAAAARFTSTALPGTLTLQVQPGRIVWTRTGMSSYSMLGELHAFVTDSHGSRVIGPVITWEAASPASPPSNWDSVSVGRTGITVDIRLAFPLTITAWAVFEDQRIAGTLPVMPQIGLVSGSGKEP